MLTALVSFIVFAIIVAGLAAHPGATLALIALAVLIMMFPLWALAIFAVFATAFGIIWVKA